jgi:transposase
MRERRKFSREFKTEAVRLVKESGATIGEVARDLEIRADMLRRWKRQVEEEGRSAFPGSGRRWIGMRKSGGCSGSCGG